MHRIHYICRLLLTVSLFLMMTLPIFADVMTAKQAELWLIQQQHDLLADSEQDHVVSYYYFGSQQQRSLIGLERVRGDHYQSQFSLMIFEQGRLLGFYPSLPSLPLALSADGVIHFPQRFAQVTDGLPLTLAAPADVLCLAEFRPCANWQQERTRQHTLPH